MKNIYFFILLFINIQILSAQDYLHWVKRIGGINNETSVLIKKDSFMGTSIFGDSYKLGTTKVKKIIFKKFGSLK